MATLRTGAPAPDFTLADQNGRAVTLADFRGSKLLLFFYPRADTSGCTTQACALRDALAELAASGVKVAGVSPDVPESQLKFDRKYNLAFTLLADSDHLVATAYGVWGEKTMYGRKVMGIIRSAFLIDEQGIVAQAWYRVNPDDTVPRVKATLRGAT